MKEQIFQILFWINVVFVVVFDMVQLPEMVHGLEDLELLSLLPPLPYQAASAGSDKLNEVACRK